MHASVSLIAYGAFALACVAGLMYLVQERQLKSRQINSMFYHFPPLTDLFAAITRLLWLGFVLLTVGIVAGFFTGQPLPYMKVAWSLGVWIFYAAILLARHLGTDRPALDRRPLRRRLQRGTDIALGDNVPFADALALMNLFCVGLSHHTANVETRERFVGHAAIDRHPTRRCWLHGGAAPHHLQPGGSLCRLRRTGADRADRALPAGEGDGR